MEPSLCLDCGFNIGQYTNAFMYMKQVLLSGSNTSIIPSENQVHIDIKPLDPTSNENLIPIFKELKINRICCRSQLTSSIRMTDLW